MFNRIRVNALILLLFFNTTFLSAISDQNLSIDATSIDFEQLLQTEYIPASHIANNVNKASSAVAVVTAQDIKDYGYRTLGEILGSMRGLQVFQNYHYNFLGGRGFSAPGEYAGRIAVLIDGYRADDGMFGQSYLGPDGLLDVAMIEKVEYIPGGGSAGYSSGALLGLSISSLKKVMILMVENSLLGMEIIIVRQKEQVLVKNLIMDLKYC